VSAKIPNYKNLNPTSVGMALLGVKSLLPYAYDSKTGSITLMINDAVKALQGKYHRAVVWATDAKTGKRVEASWTFELPEEMLPAKVPPAVSPARIAPTTTPTRRTVSVVPITGGAAIVSHR